MNKLILITVFLVGGVGVNGQDVSESVYSYKDKFSPLLSIETGVLYIDLVKQYAIGSGDTSFVFIIDLQEDQLELTGVSLGSTLFGHTSYGLNKTREQSVMNKEGFFEFYDCIKRVHSFIGNQKDYGTSTNDMVATCGVSNIMMGGEYSGDDTKFYFRIGENATYSMKVSQFIEVVKVLSKIKDYWGGRV